MREYQCNLNIDVNVPEDIYEINIVDGDNLNHKQKLNKFNIVWYLLLHQYTNDMHIPNIFGKSREYKVLDTGANLVFH